MFDLRSDHIICSAPLFRAGFDKLSVVICVNLCPFAVKFIMNNNDFSDIVKVTAAILVKDNKLIIAKRGPDDRLANKWEFPGGKIEINETPEKCLKREMKEEFDIDVSIGEYLGSIPIPWYLILTLAHFRSL